MTQVPVRTTQPHDNRAIRRRNFISTAILGGMTVALVPSARALASGSSEATDVLPSPADSLSFYLIHLDGVQRNILHTYFELVACLAGEVRSRYQQLKQDVAELERLAPQLQSSGASNLRRATDIGEASAASIKDLSDQGLVLTGAHISLVSFSSDTLNDSLVEWERGRLTLSPQAVALLRKILREVRELNLPTEGLEKSSRLLTDVDNDLSAKFRVIKSNVMSAINDLVADDLAGESGPKVREARAKKAIQDAIGQLQALDSYEPPESLRAYITETQASQCKNFKPRSAELKPTQNLRDLLTGTVKWIEQGGQLSFRDRNPMTEVRYEEVSIGHSPAPDWAARWDKTRQVLGELLPPGSRTRTFICLCLIGPILAGYDEAQRVNLIYDQIPNIMPGSTFNGDVPRRTQAAQRLANL